MKLEYYITKKAKVHDGESLFRIKSIPGIGETLSLIILYEIHTIKRFPRVQDFVSYSRLVKPSKESAGKIYGHTGRKIGNAHLKWAFSEAAVLMLREIPESWKRYCWLIDELSPIIRSGGSLCLTYGGLISVIFSF